eukprot:scaffold823_cov397-Prasinococcus_capsulatus_cf.AAC.3
MKRRALYFFVAALCLIALSVNLRAISSSSPRAALKTTPRNRTVGERLEELPFEPFAVATYARCSIVFAIAVVQHSESEWREETSVYLTLVRACPQQTAVTSYHHGWGLGSDPSLVWRCPNHVAESNLSPAHAPTRLRRCVDRRAHKAIL